MTEGQKDLPRVLSFSGGRTSGYMLRREIDRIGIEAYRRDFLTLFCNTGKEHDATLDFVHEVQAKWGVPIVWLEYCRQPAIGIPLEALPEGRKHDNLRKLQEAGEESHWFQTVNYETAARENDLGPFDALLDWANVLPNVRTRSCSVQMKLRTMQRYLGSLGIFEYQSFIGIRGDEAHRKLEILANITNGEHPAFPLIDDRQTKEHVHAFWDSHPFQLNLPVVNGETIEGNCRRCYLKAAWKLIQGIKDDPESADWWLAKETEFQAKATGDGAVFRKGRPFSKLVKIAKALPPGPITPPRMKGKPSEQASMLDFGEEDVACSCAVGGYRGNTDDEP